MAHDRSPAEPVSQEVEAAAQVYLSADLARMAAVAEVAPESWWKNPDVQQAGRRLQDLLDDRLAP